MDTKFHRWGIRSHISPSTAIFDSPRACLSLSRCLPLHTPFVFPHRIRGPARVGESARVSGSLWLGSTSLTLKPDDFKWPSAWAADRYFLSVAIRKKSPGNGNQRAEATISRGRPRVWCNCALSASTRMWIPKRHHVTCTKVLARGTLGHAWKRNWKDRNNCRSQRFSIDTVVTFTLMFLSFSRFID